MHRGAALVQPESVAPRRCQRGSLTLRAYDARTHLASLVDHEIKITGRPTRVLRIEGDDVVVATARSPEGKPVPIAWVQEALDMLERDGEVVADVETLGYRSAFIGAVLATLCHTTRALGPSRVTRQPLRG